MEQLTLKLGGLTPQTLSMERLAEYLHELAKLYGEPDSVHFDSVSEGSAELNALVDEAAFSQVMERVTTAPMEDGTREARAYTKLSEFMAADGTEGEVWTTDSKVIEFPRPKVEPPTLRITKYSSVQGRIYNLGGKDKTNPVKLEGANGETLLCDADPDMAKRLRPFLFEYVRVRGRSTWQRHDDRHWSLVKLWIDSFESLQEESLREAIDRIRQLNEQHTA